MTSEERIYKINKINEYSDEISERKKIIILDTIVLAGLAGIALLSMNGNDMSTFENFIVSVTPETILAMPTFFSLAYNIGKKTVYEKEKNILNEEINKGGR